MAETSTERIAEIMREVANWDLDDIRELQSQCESLADCIEQDYRE